MNSFVNITQMDAIAFLRVQPSESVDLVITDPAYESMNKHRSIGTTTRMKAFFETVPNSYYIEWVKELYRVMKRNSHGYIFCDEETADVIKPILVANGFKFWKSLVWDKQHKGMGYHWCNQHEFILFFEKGKRKLNHNSGRSVLHHPGVRRLKTDPLYYPTEKNKELIKELIVNSSYAGDLVLDCFGGSFATMEACIETQRNFIGCDIAEDSIRMAKTKLHGSGLDILSNFQDKNMIQTKIEFVGIE